MNTEYIVKGMMVAQYLEMIGKAEKQLEVLRDGLFAIICPEIYEDVCDECRADETAGRFEFN